MAADPKYVEYQNVQATTALADGKETFLGMKTRWAFVTDWLPVWKEYVRYRLYSYILFIVGAFTLFSIPYIAVPAFFGAVMYHYVSLHKQERLTSDRKVIWGH